ncbi:hypothetical protein A5641_12200 [Mycobacterium sp. 1554424.7]|nr:hypothetical protein A5641_12200 [Mycobacterium sp. 1554424.7]
MARLADTFDIFDPDAGMPHGWGWLRRFWFLLQVICIVAAVHYCAAVLTDITGFMHACERLLDNVTTSMEPYATAIKGVLAFVEVMGPSYDIASKLEDSGSTGDTTLSIKIAGFGVATLVGVLVYMRPEYDLLLHLAVASFVVWGILRAIIWRRK